MSQPSYELLIYFGETATASTSFVLSDSTRGALNAVAYTLGGDTGTDVTADAVGFSITRGKSSPLFPDIDAGTAQVELNNEDRTYDPLYAAGTHYGDLTPGKRVRFLANGIVLFDGQVADWDLSYDVNGRSVATAKCEDALAVLGRQVFDAWTATASQTAGPRLTAILNRSEVGWSGGARDLDTGISTLQGDSVTAESNVLNYCQLVARSDLGSFFASREGVLTFRDRHSAITSASAITFGTGGVPITGVGVRVGSETYFTRVAVDREGGVRQTYTSASATTDGIRTLSYTGLLLDSDAQSDAMAEYLATMYATGDPVVSEITTVLDDTRLTTAQMAVLLSLELNDVVSIDWTPNGVGAAITQDLVIAGIKHDAFPGLHTLTFYTSKYDTRAPFILDSTSNGTLGNPGVLAF